MMPGLLNSTHKQIMLPFVIFEPRNDKTCVRGFRPGQKQKGLYSYRKWLETCIYGLESRGIVLIYVAKTKALISFAITYRKADPLLCFRL